ncbi:PAS domain S-box protein [Polaribacter sp. Hel1_33_49]|uniref:PAS domain-containing sensor histidine kinase n=2 Tax=Polaribacter TaxID=52959 RepID=UPI00052D124E|nr:sensory transduction histidine kinase [Polaribacter sp. Hel1_33_49]
MLNKEQDIFNVLFEAVSEGVIVVDDQQKIVSINSSIEKMFGYEKDELVHEKLNILIPKNYHAGHGDHFKSFLNKKEKRQMGKGRHLYGARKNGDIFPLEAGLNPFKIYGKNFIMALIIDVSERKKAEEELIHWANIFNESLNEIYIIDADTLKFINANQGAQKNIGYNLSELKNMTPVDIMAEKLGAKLAKILNPLREGKKKRVVFEDMHERKNGTKYPVEVHLQLSSLHTKVVLVAITIDITVRKKAEQELTHWANIFNESLNEIYIFNSDTYKFINVNLGAQKNIGYDLTELKSLTPLDIKPDYTEAQFRKKVQPLLEKKEDKLIFETVHLRKNGTKYPVEIHLQLSTFKGKEVFVAIILDITERKNYTKKLENTVDQRTIELKKALAKEKELNELKTKFLSLVSHEFKTPLSGILTSTILLGKYKLTEQQEKREKHLETITNKVHYLNNILNDFLSVEKLETGKIKYKYDNFKLSKVVDEVIYNANMLLKVGQKIKYPENIDEISLIQDEKTIELSLSNLVNNAIKYSPENSVIEIGIKQDAFHTTFNIKDNGMGIPEADQKNIFNRYFRAENALLTQGTGIGLNIIKSHLENIGGTITFESKENIGSTFVMKIINEVLL